VNILLCNDDGYRARGLRRLARALSADHCVTVCAPHLECSATGHGLTLREPLRVLVDDEDGLRYHGVGGLPADAAKFGLSHLCAGNPPDLLISGINHGANTGQNLFYSGTVAAAAEGTFAGVPSLAVSLAALPGEDLDAGLETAVAAVLRVLRLLEAHPLPAEVLLNMNVPNRPAPQVKGLRVSRMGHARFHEVFHQRQDPAGRVYFWMDGAKNGDDLEPEHDDHQVHADWVSLTPLRLDLTHPAWESLLDPWDLAAHTLSREDA
jgi:5'-nucleotidase